MISWRSNGPWPLLYCQNIPHPSPQGFYRGPRGQCSNSVPFAITPHQIWRRGCNIAGMPGCDAERCGSSNLMRGVRKFPASPFHTPSARATDLGCYAGQRNIGLEERCPPQKSGTSEPKCPGRFFTTHSVPEAPPHCGRVLSHNDPRKFAGKSFSLFFGGQNRISD